MSTTTATTSALAIFENIIEGVAFYLADATVYLLVFAFMFGMFTSMITIMTLWKNR